VDENTYRLLTRITIALLVVSIGWITYSSFNSERETGTVSILAGDRAFADGNYDRALRNYDESLKEAPNQIDALRGKARTLLQLGRLEEALAYFNQAIEQDPGFAGTYANRGITHDRMGLHEEALKDYEYALYLKPEVADGPGLITRILHMDGAGPPTIADRANYLREQLALPPEQRLLAVPEEDKSQRSYSKRLK
jgi:tetratricopeptide (TPR) repeat protein